MCSVVPQKRYIDIDTLSGILILQMIFVVHCAKLSGINGIVIDKEMLIMQFFMPWFFYKSGMLYHENSISNTIKKNIRHLIKPFIIFSLIGWIIIVVAPGIFVFHKPIGYLVSDTLQHFVSDGSFRGNYALWFLLSLFVVKCLFPIIKKAHIPILLIIIVSFALAFMHNRLYHYMPIYLGNIPNGLFFYSLGYAMRECQYQKNLLIICIIAFPLLFPFAGYLDFRANAIMQGNNYFILTEALIICEIIIANNIVKSWGGCNRKNIFATVGRSAMILYVTHYIILVVSENALKMLLNESNPFIMFGLNSLVLIIFLPLVCCFFRNKAVKRICF